MPENMNQPQAKTPEWHDLYAANFHRLSPGDVDTWNYELFQGERRIRALTKEFLCNAIRKLAKEAHRDKEDRPIPPKLEHVRSAIFAMLQASKQREAPTGICSECGVTGFMDGYRVLYDDATRSKVMGVCTSTDCGELCQYKGQGVVCYDTAIPCPRCQRGESAAKYSKATPEVIRQLQGMIQQAKSRQ